ncbi:hypothetical protein QOM18_00670 [Serratia marcescens]|uniref:hypothetical protein n=1 Tax=Serratia marcescens TaxID=615 RepID=UPI0024C4C005|nr:hypothetical protein [Serratia marcescens]MDK1706824.1 hypothetical protein [Serratia marcescens]
MDNKLSELSKPVAFIESAEKLKAEAGFAVTVQPIKRWGADIPLYSQEYVSALLAELKSSQGIANEYQKLMYHMDAGGDFYEFQRDKAMKEQSNG